MEIPSLHSAQMLVSAVVLILFVHVILGIVTYSIYLERKISAYIQDRVGPNRVGFDFGLPFLKFLKGCFGLGQPLADGIKFFLKEDYTPEKVDKALFTLAPMLIVVPALIGFAVIPWGGIWHIKDFSILGWTFNGGDIHITGTTANVGIIYLLAVASLGVYGITLGGWASNNKYSFLGGLRSTAQMLAYEIPLGLALLCVLLIVGSVVPDNIIRYQVHHGWLIVAQPLACVIFFTAALAEANRAPFDNAEAEQELVGGYHTEYSSMRFALFFLAEYAHMVTSSAFFALLFLGGYHLPIGLIAGADHILTPENTTLLAVLAKCAVYLTKVVLLVCFMMVIRWTLPRMRFDQVMMMAWQAVIPLSLAAVVMTSVMVYLDLRDWGPMLAANVLLIGLLLGIYPLLPKYTPNRKVPLYGSRFNPMPGELVRTGPSDPTALEDRPVPGTAPVA
jgi:NADH-quinone oxidoreductase subunit H